MNILQQVGIGLLAAAIFVFCDYTVTRWAESISLDGYWTWRLAFAVIAAPLGIVALGLVGARMGLAAVVGFVNAGVVAGGTFAGVFLRREHLTMAQRIGLVAAILAIVLVNFGRSTSASPPATPVGGF